MTNPVADMQAMIEASVAKSFADVASVVHVDGLTHGLRADGHVVWTMGTGAWERFKDNVTKEQKQSPCP